MRLSAQLLLVALGAATLAAGAATGASAETNWQRHHPWRVEINQRLARQDMRINQERREGEISGREAWRLHAEDRRIYAQERFDASQHYSHLTRAQVRRLNWEENNVSGQIGR